MDDESYVADLLGLLADPSTSVDRALARDLGLRLGRGSWLRVTGGESVAGPHGLELRVDLVVEEMFEDGRHVRPLEGAVMVPVEREWREMSGYADPAAYAMTVADAAEREASAMVARASSSDEYAPDGALRDLVPARETQWRWLLDALARQGRVHEVEQGRIEVTVEVEDRPGPPQAPLLTVLVTPDQWEEVLAHTVGDEPDLYLGELFASSDPDESYVVCWRNELVRSTREKLPPVRGRGWSQWFSELRERADAEGVEHGWVAYPPLAEE